MAGCAGSRGLLGHEDDEVPRAVNALDPGQLDVGGRRWAGDERHGGAGGADDLGDRAIASGTSPTIRCSSTMQTWRSGMRVSARRPSPGPHESTIVPVSAIPRVDPVRTPSSSSSSAGERLLSSTSASRRRARRDATRSEGPPAPRSACVVGLERRGNGGRELGGPDTPDLGLVVPDPLAEELDPRFGPELARAAVETRIVAPAPSRRSPPRTRSSTSSRASVISVTTVRKLSLRETAGGRGSSRVQAASGPGRRRIVPFLRKGVARSGRAAAPAQPAGAAEDPGDGAHRPPLAGPPAASTACRAGAGARAGCRSSPGTPRSRHRTDVEANGSVGACSIPCSCGVRIAPIGPGIDGAVGVAAGSRVDRADVQAGAAADAVRAPGGRPRRQHAGASRIEQDDVQLLRAVPGVTPVQSEV